MVENRVSALPVVDSRMHCIGVISVTDLVGMTKELSDELNAFPSLAGGIIKHWCKNSSTPICSPSR